MLSPDASKVLKDYALAYFRDVKLYTAGSQQVCDIARTRLESHVVMEGGERKKGELSRKTYLLIKKLLQYAAVCAHYEHIGIFQKAEVYRNSMETYYKKIVDSDEVSETLLQSIQWMAWDVVWEFTNKSEEYTNERELVNNNNEYRWNRINSGSVDYYFDDFRMVAHHETLSL